MTCKDSSTTVESEAGKDPEKPYALPLREGESYPLDITPLRPLVTSGDDTQEEPPEEPSTQNADVWGPYAANMMGGADD